MHKEVLKIFINKVSNFPTWVKDVILEELEKNKTNNSQTIKDFLSFRPSLTFKGASETSNNKNIFDSNFINVLKLIKQNYSIAEISFDTYLTLQEITSYLILGIRENLIEEPKDSKILDTANFIIGKSKTGEYFNNIGIITKEQLSIAIEKDTTNKKDRRFGEILVDMQAISKQDLKNTFTLKEESRKRFILDYNDIPNIKQEYSNDSDKYLKEIELLKLENQKLKSKLKILSSMVK